MMKAKDLYTVISAVFPLYVTMFLAYGSVKWWNIFSPEQCAGINRFVATFAVPLLSFEFIYNFNPYKMNFKFIAADVISKAIVLVVLGLWGKFARKERLDWVITLFSLSTLPNTLVMGIPLLKAMYGDYAETLMVQTVVLQCIVWYTLMLFLFEYRSAKILIAEQFPGIANSIASFKVESDVLSLDGRDFLYTDAEVGEDGKLHVVVRKSSSSLSRGNSAASSQRFHSTKSFTPGKPINHSACVHTHIHTRHHSEVFSVESSRNLTPTDSGFNKLDYASGVPALSNANNSLYPYEFDAPSQRSSVGHTPRTSNGNDDPNLGTRTLNSNCNRVKNYSTSEEPSPLENGNGNGIHGSRREQLEGAAVINCGCRNLYTGGNLGINAVQLTKRIPDSIKHDEDAKELHMFVWSSSGSPVSEGGGLQLLGASDFVMEDSSHHEFDNIREERTTTASANEQVGRPGLVAEPVQSCQEYSEEQDFSFANTDRIMANQRSEGPRLSKFSSNSTAAFTPRLLGEGDGHANDTPRAAVMINLILNMVFRKLIRNPNSYASVLGIIWALVSYRWHFKMPQIIKGSVSILSDAGLGMAMFSLGLFMALQPKIIACGKDLAVFGMVVRFLTGPAVMAVASIIAGLRDTVLHIAIVQAALPQGIVPFVFAREYNLHPDVLSTAVIFGMIVAMPITILYYILLGL